MASGTAKRAEPSEHQASQKTPHKTLARLTQPAHHLYLPGRTLNEQVDSCVRRFPSIWRRGPHLLLHRRAGVDDGVLGPFLRPHGRDTRHRITSNAYDQLTEHHRPAYLQYLEADFLRFYLNELLALTPESVRVYEKNIGVAGSPLATSRRKIDALSR